MLAGGISSPVLVSALKGRAHKSDLRILPPMESLYWYSMSNNCSQQNQLRKTWLSRSSCCLITTKVHTREFRLRIKGSRLRGRLWTGAEVPQDRKVTGSRLCNHPFVSSILCIYSRVYLVGKSDRSTIQALVTNLGAPLLELLKVSRFGLVHEVCDVFHLKTEKLAPSKYNKNRECKLHTKVGKEDFASGLS